MAKAGYLYTLKTTGEVVEREVVIVQHRDGFSSALTMR